MRRSLVVVVVVDGAAAAGQSDGGDLDGAAGVGVRGNGGGGEEGERERERKGIFFSVCFEQSFSPSVLLPRFSLNPSPISYLEHSQGDVSLVLGQDALVGGRRGCVVSWV